MSILFPLAIILFAILLGLLPTLLILMKGRLIGLKLNFADSYRISKLRAPKKAFLLSAYEYEKNGFPMTVIELIAHVWAGGSIDNCLEGLKYAKENNIDLTFNMAVAIDLTNKNVKESLLDSHKVYNLETETLQNNELKLNYTASYKYAVPSVFIDKDANNINAKITSKLKVFLETWSNTNIVETEKMIRENILNADYWESNLRVIMLNQEYKIRKK